MAVQPVAWPDHAALEQNRRNLRKSLRRELREYEARYELSSERVEDELSAGRLRETREVCEWVITLHTYRRLAGGG